MPTLKYTVIRKHFSQGVISKSWKTINKRPLQHAGLLVRKIWRGSIRRVTNDKPSKPGKPPHAHKPKEYKGLDDFKKIYSVPAPWGTAEIVGQESVRAHKQTPMEIQEFGQRVEITTYKQRGKARSKRQAEAARRLFLAGRIKSKSRQKESRTVQMPKRPAGAPALDKARSKLPALWANSITSSTVKNVL